MRAKAAFFNQSLTLVLIILFMGVMNLVMAQDLKYPAARVSDVVDNYHGTKVADPYRWLEDPEAAETHTWVEQENQLTHSFIDAIPARKLLQQRFTEIINYPKYGLPFRRGAHYFFSKNDGLQNQAVLYLQNSLNDTPKVLIDPNKLSTDGTVALTGTTFTKDGTLLAYSLSSSGSDRQDIHIRNVDTGKDYDEVIKWCKFTSIAWTPDKAGFYYNRFPEPGTVSSEDENNFSRVYWHKLGTPQAADLLVYEDPQNKELFFSPIITEDGKHLFIYVTKGTDPESQIYYRDIDSQDKFTHLVDRFDASYQVIDTIGSTLYIQTDLGAPRGRVMAVDLKNPARNHWREVIPQQADVLSGVSVINDQFVVTYRKDAHDQLKIYNFDGSFIQDIELPTIGSVGGVSGQREDKEMFISFTSYVYPPTSFKYNFPTGKMDVFRAAEVKFDPTKYETKQIFYTSKDGTKVPMFITAKKGLTLDGSNPTLLYGYGGFNISLTPAFSTSLAVWLEHGGVYVVANLRGGDEYGEAWHKAGTLEKKQNVFDDFISAGEWLVANKYTSTSKLAIMGGSNGGLLVAACLLQRPDLFGAAICQVPVIDMLRYHKFTVGRYWVGEYGNAETNPEHFKFMYAYSPLHNVKKGTKYPSVLITTADTDDRVVPSHAKKFAATLQAAQGGDKPVLIRIETKAGHGAGKPISKIIDEQSDTYAFLFKALGVN